MKFTQIIKGKTGIVAVFETVNGKLEMDQMDLAKKANSNENDEILHALNELRKAKEIER